MFGFFCLIKQNMGCWGGSTHQKFTRAGFGLRQSNFSGAPTSNMKKQYTPVRWPEVYQDMFPLWVYSRFPLLLLTGLLSELPKVGGQGMLALGALSGFATVLLTCCGQGLAPQQALATRGQRCSPEANHDGKRVWEEFSRKIMVPLLASGFGAWEME